MNTKTTVDPAWASVGKYVDSRFKDPQKILEKSGLNWDVETKPCFAQMGPDKYIPIGKQLLVKGTDNAVLDIISEDWKPMQNSDALEFFSEFAELCDAKLDAIGSLRDEKIIWVTAKLPESFTVSRGDVVQAYLLFTNPHSYGQSSDIRFMAVREASQTSLVLPLKDSTQARNRVRINHRAEFYPDFVKDTIEGSKTRMANIENFSKAMAKTKVPDGAAEDFLKAIFPRDGDSDLNRNSRHVLDEIMINGPGMEYSQGSYWNLFNAVCYLIDHEMGRTDDNRIHSSWYGTGQKLKIRAFELAAKKST